MTVFHKKKINLLLLNETQITCQKMNTVASCLEYPKKVSVTWSNDCSAFSKKQDKENLQSLWCSLIKSAGTEHPVHCSKQLNDL